MTTRISTPSLEPSAESVTAVQERLKQWGFLLGDDSARSLLRTVLAIESAQLDRRARDAATACLRSIQDAAEEALEILTQGPAPVVAPAAAPAAAPRPIAKRPETPVSAPRDKPRDEPANLAQIVRQRLGDEVPPDAGGFEPDSFSRDPKRPVFKHPRRR